MALLHASFHLIASDPVKVDDPESGKWLTLDLGEYSTGVVIHASWEQLLRIAATIEAAYAASGKGRVTDSGRVFPAPTRTMGIGGPRHMGLIDGREHDGELLGPERDAYPLEP